jgi:hypothetical protein
MTDNRNRRLTLTRKKDEPEPEGPREDPRDLATEIPRASKAEIRHLIETEGLGSPTEISARLNADGFPCAQADAWSAKLVDSALRRQDMLDLKERLKENRHIEDPVRPSVTAEEVLKAAFDGAKSALDKMDIRGAVKDAVKLPEVKFPEIPPIKIDTFTMKETVSEAVDKTLKEHLRAFEAADRASAAEISTSVRKALEGALTTAFSHADMVAVRRVTDATSRNVGDILKRIDVVCEDLHDTVTKSFADHRKEVSNTCENMALQVCDQVDKRMNAVETALVERLSKHGVLDEILGRVVDVRLKAHLDTVVNQFAVMVEGMKRDLRTEGKR